jgi:Ser/Thr protein kinase RdoA (MazF antagonist)
VWFKANQEALRHEAALVTLLSARVPDRVPPLLAADPDRGWMLMADAGERLRTVVPEERSLDRWLDALEATARIGLALEDDVDALLALGVPDLRLPTLPGRYARLMDEIDAEPRFRDALPRVEELADGLAAYGIAETIQHDDLHDGQVFVLDDRQLIMDWGDACVSHPLFTLSVTLEGVIAWGLDVVEDSVDTTPFRDAFLRPYAERYPALDMAGLAEASALAVRLGWACRAVNGHMPGHPDQTAARLRMFFDGRA